MLVNFLEATSSSNVLWFFEKLKKKKIWNEREISENDLLSEVPSELRQTSLIFLVFLK